MPYRLDIPGWMPEQDLQYIETLAARVPDHGRIIEVGSFYGRSAWAWARSAPSATVHCIDLWLGCTVEEPNSHSNVSVFDERHFVEFTKDCGNITRTRGDSNRVLPTLPQQTYDLIFLDGAHTNPQYENDLELAFPLLKNGGILCGHDFISAWPDIIRATTYFAANHQKPIWFGQRTTIWVIEK